MYRERSESRSTPQQRIVDQYPAMIINLYSVFPGTYGGGYYINLVGPEGRGKEEGPDVRTNLSIAQKQPDKQEQPQALSRSLSLSLSPVNRVQGTYIRRAQGTSQSV